MNISWGGKTLFSQETLVEKSNRQHLTLLPYFNPECDEHEPPNISTAIILKH